MTHKIPPLRPPDQMPPVHTQADLERHWRALMGPLGFGRAALWLQLITADGRVDGLITQVEELPERPEQDLLDNLLAICAQLVDSDLPGSRVAFLYARPGTRQVTDDDRAWACGLTKAAQKAGVRCEPVHLANDEDLRAFAPDDLVPASTA